MELNGAELHTAASSLDAAEVSRTVFYCGRNAQPPAPMRVLHRFTKPDGHWAEIRERKVTFAELFEQLDAERLRMIR